MILHCMLTVDGIPVLLQESHPLKLGLETEKNHQLYNCETYFKTIDLGCVTQTHK